MLASTDLATKTQENKTRKLKENIKTTGGNPLVSNPRPIYNKHNSFVEIRQNQKNTLAAAIDRVANLRQRDNLTAKMSKAHRQIFNQVCTDLVGFDSSDNSSRFSLSPSVAEEIATYSDSDLPRYLVHRYRYEIFPKLKILDQYPPYLQIEPTSICNFRCVFCFETDPNFTNKTNGYMG